MIEIVGLVVLLAISVVVFCGWLFLKTYCLVATEYLSKHSKIDFIIHVFTGAGFAWLIAFWIPKNLALVFGTVLLIVVAIMRFAIPREKLPKHLRSSGMGGGLPTGIGVAWLAYPWIPEILTLILGAVSMIAAETVHYVFPNLVTKR